MVEAVRFVFFTGIIQPVFSNVRLSGSWNSEGLPSANWSSVTMQQVTGIDGCPAFEAFVSLDASQSGQTFRWGVTLDGPAGPNLWGIATEVGDPNLTDRYRSFVLEGGATTQEVQYYFTIGRRLGAHKLYTSTGAEPRIAFSVWAPNAQAVDVVFGVQNCGYIDDSGGGVDQSVPAIPLAKGADGIWDSDPALHAFADLEGKPYMYRIRNEQGIIRYRTDLYSREQIGVGGNNPKGNPYNGSFQDLDGTVSCSVVRDPDVVILPSSAGSPPTQIAAQDFWAGEFSSARPVPTQMEDLVIYEMHVGSLGFGKAGPGDLNDAIAFLDHLTLLGVNAIELLPMSQFDGTAAWGYGDSHHFAIQSSAGGRDQYQLFVRECHSRGLAVIQDVVYNHFDSQAERAEWHYDSDAENDNIYYWYEGVPSNYPDSDGGYLDNGSSGWTPRFWEELVRSLFVSSAAAFVKEFHVDGFRVDLTDAIHQNNALHSNGSPVGNANQFGSKFLREWSRTLRMLKPTVMLAAEDYTGWDKMTQLPDNGGLGFDSIWYADFVHHLVGDGNYGPSYARLIHTAGLGGDGPLAMDYFGGALQGSGTNKVVYQENHDEAGNEANTRRTIVEAVNGAPIIGDTREFAEARCRVAMGMNILSAGTPMFFMAEEIGAQNIFLYQSTEFLGAREDILGGTTGQGALPFRFYQDIIGLRLHHPALRTHQLNLAYVHNVNRVIAFLRPEPTEQLLVIASLANTPFANGYAIAAGSALPDGNWQEIFNSDANNYGGANVGNFGAVVPSSQGNIRVRIPANGFLVFSKA
jgi:1,4-alpha-glucan branching enzyme